VETVKPNEEDTASKIADFMNRMQRRNFAKHRHAFRATHIKVQGIAKGVLHVKDDLSPHLRQGMFATPGKEYPIIARYANEPYLLQAGQEPAPRGLSMKVFNVTGPHLPAGQGIVSQTQDWLFNNASSIELTDIDTCLEIMSLQDQDFDDPNTHGLKLRMCKDARKQMAPYKLPTTHLVSHEFFTQSAFRFGEYYGRLGLFPVLDSQTSRTESVGNKDSNNALADWLQDYFGAYPAVYEFRIQSQAVLWRNPAHLGRLRAASLE
jgi:hypothetical protein